MAAALDRVVGAGAGHADVDHEVRFLGMQGGDQGPDGAVRDVDGFRVNEEADRREEGGGGRGSHGFGSDGREVSGEGANDLPGRVYGVVLLEWLEKGVNKR